MTQRISIGGWSTAALLTSILWIFAFMEAADESKRQGGAPVSLASVLAKARTEAAAKLAK